MVKRIVTEIAVSAFLSAIVFSLVSKSNPYHVYIELCGRFEHDMHVQLFYANNHLYDQERSTVMPVSRSINFQTLKFEIPQDTIFSDFRFDLGSEKGNFLLKSISIKSFDKSIEWSSKDIVKDFLPSPNIEKFIIKDSLVYISMHPDDPYIYLKGSIKNQYKSLTEYGKRRSVLFPLYYSVFIFAIVMLCFRMTNLFASTSSDPNKNIAILFFLLLSLPLLNMVFEFIPEVENHEKRKLASKPIYNIDDINNYPQQFNNYFNDHFGFRSFLVKCHSYFRFKIFHSSPLPSKVLLGKDNWLFISEYDDQLIRADPLYSEQELYNLESNVEKRALELKKQGIDYYLLIAPDKSAIYPEYLPRGYELRNPNTLLDQVFNKLKHNKNIHVVDVRDVLLKEKSTRDLYYSSDTHWNIYGAMIGYKKLIETIRVNHPDITTHNLSDFNFVLYQSQEGDLADQFNSPELFTKRTWIPRLKEDKDSTNILNFKPYIEKKIVHKNNDSTKTKKIVMFHDSFGLYFMKPMSEDFGEAIFSWTHVYNPTIIDEHKPDIVVQEAVSRFIPMLNE